MKMATTMEGLDVSSWMIIGIILLSVLLFLTVFVAVLHSGLFHSIEIDTGAPPIGSFQAVYKFGRGPYSDSGAIFTEVVSLHPQAKTFGVYYDDPKSVQPRDLRWAVGCITAEGCASPDKDLVQSFTEKGFKEFSFPAVDNAVVTHFPFRTQLSIFIGVFRVYPQLSAYVKDRKLCAHPMLEVYSSDKIHYMAPLCMQDEFYVPEAEAEDNEMSNPSGSDAGESDSTEDSLNSGSDASSFDMPSTPLTEGIKHRAKSERLPDDPTVSELRKVGQKSNTPML